MAGYEVQRGTSIASRQLVAASLTSFRFLGLTNGTTYDLYVRARNEAGFGPWASASARPATVPSAPRSVDASGSSHRIRLSWSSRSGDDGGAPLAGYQVQVGRSASTRTSLAPTRRSVTFPHLVFGRTSRVCVRARNALGFGPWASDRATPASRPARPSSPHTRAASHRARLYWAYPAGGNGGAPIRVPGAPWLARRQPGDVGPAARSHLFRSLRNGVRYTLYLRAYNRVGYGSWARATARPHAASAPKPPGGGCTPGYSPCLPPASDYDCAGGSGNGPKFVDGPVYVTGSDPYGLDSDGDGVACES